MSCEMIRAMLNDYLDGYLSEEEGRKVASHLAECPSCEAEFKVLKSLQEEVGELPLVKAPSGFKDAVLDRMEPAEEAPPSLPQTRPPRLLRWMPISLAAALVLATLSVYFVFLAPDRTAPSRERVAQYELKDRNAAREESLLMEKEVGVEDSDGYAFGGETAAAGSVRAKDEEVALDSKKKQRPGQELNKRLRSLGYEGLTEKESEWAADRERASALEKKSAPTVQDDAPPASVDPPIPETRNLPETLRDSGMDTLVVMGAENWSLPTDFQGRAMESGSLRMFGSLPPSTESAVRLRATPDSEADKSKEKIMGKAQADGPAGPPAGPTAGSRAGTGPSSPGAGGAVGGAVSDWNYVILDGTDEEIALMVSRLVQSQPDEIWGARFADRVEAPISAGGDRDGDTLCRLSEPRIMWSRTLNKGDASKDISGAQGYLAGRGRRADLREELRKSPDAALTVQLKPKPGALHETAPEPAEEILEEAEQAEETADAKPDAVREALKRLKSEDAPRRRLILIFPNRKETK